jgi:ATP-dependent DNA helicase RecG
VIVQARADATALVDGDPALTDHPALAAAVEALTGAGQADFLAKA